MPPRTRVLPWICFALALRSLPSAFGADGDKAPAPNSGPVQQWRFDAEHVEGNRLTPVQGGLGGEIWGAFETVDEDGLKCLELRPAPADEGAENRPGSGGILLSKDPAKAQLPTGPMSVEAWVQLEKTLEWGGIVGAVYDTGTKEEGWILGYRRDKFYFGLSTEGPRRMTYLNSRSPFVLNNWYHVAATYDGIGRQRIYVDGQLAGESGGQRGAILKPDPLFYVIGAYRDDDNDHPFSGRLTEISVWHRELGGEEIVARFEKRKAEFPGIEAGSERPGAEDEWVTWMGDNARSGRAPQDLSLHPSGKPEWVYGPALEPAPAWPETAKSDHWRKRSTPETPKVTFDWVNDVVVADGRVYFGSSADDGVRCLDAKTGRLVWVFFAGGPVRLAPTVAGDRVVFGCDDGLVYALDAKAGKLLWKRKPASVPDRRLPGNGRLMSVWPVRTGVLVKGNTGYFGAGLFPSEGAFYCSVDLRDGKMLDEKPVDFSPQGYILESGGRLLAEPGRSKKEGHFGTITTRKPGTREESRISKVARAKFPFAVVETPKLVIAGGEGKVAAFEPGGDIAVWEAEVDGAARGMAIAGGRLFVSTTTGRIYAFGAENGGVVHSELEGLVDNETGSENAEAKELVELLPRKRGYALVVGLGNGELIRALAEKTELHVVGVDTDPDKVAKLRREFGMGSRRGSFAFQEVVSYDALPFVDGIFDLIKVNDARGNVPEAEVKRLVRPWDGVALLGDGGLIRGKAPEGAGNWTHAYGDVGNSASSGDRLVSRKTRLRWFGRPGPEHIVDRHLRAPPPLSAGGYLFVPGRDYLFGLDAHNGTVLWEREIEGFMRASMLRDCGNLAFDMTSKRVFAASGAKCLVLDADTGKTVREFSLDPEKDEWGYLAVSGGLFVGSSVAKGAVRRELSYAAIWEGGYGDGKRPVCSKSLFAIDPESGNRLWNYGSRGAIVNPTLCIESGRILFLESRNEETLKAGAGGRFTYEALIGKSGADVVALDLKTGDELWRKPFEGCDKGMQTLFFSCANGHLVMVDSRNTVHVPEAVLPEVGGEGKGLPAEKSKPVPPAKPTLHYGVRVVKTDDGGALWDRLTNTGRRPNLIHGEQDLHPVIAGGRLIVEPSVFQLASGEELFQFRRQGGGGCGTISASSTQLYYRARHPAQFDLESKEQAWISEATRPGCWINMIPANGLLLVPEGSSGCVCGFPVQASMAFAPEGN